MGVLVTRWRLMNVVGLLILGMVFMPRMTPAWSATACSNSPALKTSTPSVANCGEEQTQASEEHVEEELEKQEDEEEERAIAAERAAREATDASEEATEEAHEEQAARENTTARPAGANALLKLRVRVLTRRGGSLGQSDQTRLSVATGIPAQVRVVLRAPGRPIMLFDGETLKGRGYVLRVPSLCRARSPKYSFTVTAYRKVDGQIDASDVAVRQGVFTAATRARCARSDGRS